MKVTMQFATGVVVEGTTEDGKKVQLKSVELHPFFLTAKGQSELLSVKSVSDKGVEIEELAFLVSGGNGRMTKKSRHSVEANVVADIDRQEPDKAEPAESAGDAEPADEEEDDFEETD